MWLKIEKEHLSLFTETLLVPYFENDIRRIVSKEAMVQFRKNKYSVNPKYIGYEVILKVSDTYDKIKIYYNDEEISTHILTNQPFNYRKEDMKKILQSDVFQHKTDDDIEAYIEQSLSQYDVL